MAATREQSSSMCLPQSYNAGWISAGRNAHLPTPSKGMLTLLTSPH